MFCPNCGHKNSSAAKHCVRCGKSLLIQVCPECNANHFATAPHFSLYGFEGK
ncbi:double zinc ribbon domain-containing protein [Fervidibacter sp.]